MTGSLALCSLLVILSVKQTFQSPASTAFSSPSRPDLATVSREDFLRISASVIELRERVRVLEATCASSVPKSQHVNSHFDANILSEKQHGSVMFKSHRRSRRSVEKSLSLQQLLPDFKTVQDAVRRLAKEMRQQSHQVANFTNRLLEHDQQLLILNAQSNKADDQIQVLRKTVQLQQKNLTDFRTVAFINAKEIKRRGRMQDQQYEVLLRVKDSLTWFKATLIDAFRNQSGSDVLNPSLGTLLRLRKMLSMTEIFEKKLAQVDALVVDMLNVKQNVTNNSVLASDLLKRTQVYATSLSAFNERMDRAVKKMDRLAAVIINRFLRYRRKESRNTFFKGGP